MKTEELVMKILLDSLISLTVCEAAKKAKINDVTAAKCLSKLVERGLAKRRVVAGTELYTINGRSRGIF